VAELLPEGTNIINLIRTLIPLTLINSIAQNNTDYALPSLNFEQLKFEMIQFPYCPVKQSFPKVIFISLLCLFLTISM